MAFVAAGLAVSLHEGVGHGIVAWLHAARNRANVRYFFWIFTAHNLFAGTGHFMLSGRSLSVTGRR